MPMKPSAYHRPKTLEEALRLLNNPDTKPLGGGAIMLAAGTSSAVVDLQDLGLSTLDLNAGNLIIGATTRLTDLDRFISESIQPEDPEHTDGGRTLLLSSIHRAGPNTYRNAVTVGGLIASRSEDSELLAALLVLDAGITLLDPGSQSMGVSEYLTATERPEGLITEITVPWSSGNGASERVGRTPADYPIVSVTVFKPAQGDARLAVTGIDERPTRVEEAEQALASGAGADEVALLVKNRTRHPGDFRGDSSYRAEMAFVLTKRVLDEIG